MGNYNPNLPVILGQEWVPIRNENVLFTPGVNSVEHGVGFRLSTTRQVNSGAYYTHTLPAATMVAQTTMMSVYPRGREHLSGPIQSVLIPVNSAATTGSGITIFGGSIPAALQNPGDDNAVVFEYNGGTVQEMNLFFNVTAYAPLLAGKRILNVSYVYAGAARLQTGVGDPFIDDDPLTPVSVLRRRNNSGSFLTYTRFFAANTGSLYDLNTEVSPSSGTAEYSFGTVDLGDVNIWYDNTLSPTAGLAYPWRYEELLRFESSPSDRQVLYHRFQIPNLDNGSSNPQVWLTWASLRVTYCEEQRVAYGGRYGYAAYGVNPVPLRDTSFNTNPILTAGDYSCVLSMVDPGDVSFGQGVSTPSPDFNGLRQIYTVGPQEPVKVVIPYPLLDNPYPLVNNIGETFTLEETSVLPQLSLHASGGGAVPLTEPHVYGRQVAAQVWGFLYAEQELLDTPIGASRSFPWVRFIARRFGDTTIPLTLTGTGPLAGSSTSITPDDFDELPVILDGWKEVTLQFNTPPSMGTVGTPTWQFTATGELAGNRWEVLGASAPAISGTPGNNYNLAPATRQLYTATYSAPTGDVQELVWTPQGIGSPPVSGVGTQDDSSDLFLIFAQEPPAVSGFGVATLCQPVTGIGQQCDIDPCCIPTAIQFNQLTWDAVSPSGFGYYEVQRSDTVDTDWYTIMQGTDVDGTTFNDFEARVGIETSYRIRTVDLYEFTGDWSSTITATIPEPGITIGCEGGHVLIFTSNERQDGSINLAYSSVWMEQNVSEDFTFAETSFVQIQAMYDRDYFVAFRPLERGGEQFNRTVLVQAAAISPPTLGDFRSLRDMAWEAVNYICVRDEGGNRWFSTVGVPSGRVLSNRSLYLAPVNVIQVTDTPTPVDPSDELVTGTVDTVECEA